MSVMMTILFWMILTAVKNVRAKWYFVLAALK